MVAWVIAVTSVFATLGLILWLILTEDQPGAAEQQNDGDRPRFRRALLGYDTHDVDDWLRSHAD